MKKAAVLVPEDFLQDLEGELSSPKTDQIEQAKVQNDNPPSNPPITPEGSPPETLPNGNEPNQKPPGKKGQKRIAEAMEDSMIDKFIKDNENKHTSKKTMYDTNIFIEYIKQTDDRYKHVNIEDIPHWDLNLLLLKFLIQAKKVDGTNYEPTTLDNKFASISRYSINFIYLYY